MMSLYFIPSQVNERSNVGRLNRREKDGGKVGIARASRERVAARQPADRRIESRPPVTGELYWLAR